MIHKLSIAVVTFSVLLASPGLAQAADCQGMTLDHAVNDPLVFADKKGGPDKIPGVKKAGSLTDQIQVMDCDQDYYYVRYGTDKRMRALRRLDVVAGKMNIPKCDQQANNDKTIARAGNGAVDGQICQP